MTPGSPKDTTRPESPGEARRRLAELVRASRARAAAGEQRWPLSDLQESFLVGRQLALDGDHVGCHAYLEFVVPSCDVRRLEDALNRLVSHHEMLRVVIHEEGAQGLLETPPAVRVGVSDARTLSGDDVERSVLGVRQRMSHQVYAPGQWPLFEVRVSLLPDGQDVVHVSLDEWVADATSMSILLGDWRRLYEGTGSLVAPRRTFRDFVLATRAEEGTARFQRDLAFWKKKLAALPAGPQLPRLARPPPGSRHFQRARRVAKLGADHSGVLERLAREARVSVTSLLLTVFGDLLAREGASPHFSLILTLSKRDVALPGIEDVVGPVLSTGIVIREPVAQGESLEERVRGMHRQLWDALDHGSVSGIRALRELNADGRPARTLTLPVVFTSMIHSLGQRQGWFEQQRFGVTQTPQVFLDHHVLKRDGGLELHWDVALDAYGEAQVDRWFQDYRDAVRALCVRGTLREAAAPSGGRDLPLDDVQQALMMERLSGAATRGGAVIYEEFRLERWDLTRLTDAWRILMARHPALRSFVTEEGWKRVLDTAPAFTPPLTRLTSEEALAGVRARLVAQVFPQGVWPFFALEVSVVPGSQAVVHLAVDPVVVGGPLLRKLATELFLLHAGHLLAEEPASSPVPMPAAPPEAVEADRRYWTARHADVPGGPTLPGVAPEQDGVPTRLSGRVEGAAALKRLARQWGVELDGLLLTAYMDVLREWSGAPRFSCVLVAWDEACASGTRFHWLSYPEDAGTAGQRASRYQAQLDSDRRHDAVSGLAGLRKRAHAGGPVPSFGCVYTGLLRGVDASLPSGVRSGEGLSNTPGVGLDCITFDEGEALAVHWDVRARGGDDREAREMFQRYLHTLSGLVGTAGAPASTHAAPGTKRVHRGFEDVVKRFPERIAVSQGSRRLTYRELNARANQLARHLRSLGVGPETLVALCLERTPELVIAVLGVLKAGGAYVPLDTTYPADRIRDVVEDARAPVFITLASAPQGMELDGVTILRLDADAGLIALQGTEDLEGEVPEHGAAYVIYTSGSTGRPKGVVVEHRNVARLFSSTEPWFHFGPEDVWTLFHSYAFDFSVWEMWGALLYGGRLVVVPYGVSRSFDAFHELLVEEGVTVLNLTPTAFRHLVESDVRAPPSARLQLRYVIFGGEKLNLHTLVPWFERHGESATLVNMYGITETTVHVTYRPIRPGDVHRPSLIGVPIPDLGLYLLDAAREPVAEGVIGELYVSGAGVSRGYLHRPELTAERFVWHPGLGQRLYKTGDLARRLSDGELEFIGRGDHQVQLRGFRVELGEVDAVVGQVPGIRSCAALVADAESDDPKLIAFVVPEGTMPPTAEIRRVARLRLPDYMVPNLLVPVAELPLTPEGKLDRRQLLARVPRASPEAAGPPAEGSTRLQERLSRLVAEVLRLPTVAPEADFFDLGATSLSLVQLTRRIERELGARIPVELLLNGGSVQRLVARLERPAEEGQPPVPAPRAAVLLEQVLAVLRQLLRREELAAEQDLFDAGATSLSLVNASRLLHAVTGTRVPIEVLLAKPTAAAVVTYLLARPEGTPVAAAPVEPRPSGVALTRDARLQAPGREQAGFQVASARGTLSRPVLEALLSLLLPAHAGEGARRLHASAGGKYAVEVLVGVAPQRVVGLEGGLYWLDVARAELCRVDAALAPGAIPSENETGAVRLHFAVREDRLGPTYGAIAYPLGVVEAGYMLQLLAPRLARWGVCFWPRAVEPGGLRGAFAAGVRIRVGLSVDLAMAQATPTLLTPEEVLGWGLRGDSWLLGREDVARLSGPLVLPESMSTGAEAPAAPATFSVRLPLQTVSPAAADFLLRASQRGSHPSGPVTLAQLGGLLELVGQPSPQTPAHYAALPGERPVNLLLHCREGGVEGLREGIWRYDARAHALVRVAELPMHRLKEGHAPSNRAHFARAAFGLLFTVDMARAERAWGRAGVHFSLLQVGQMGQLLMENQSAFGLGLIPIGGQGLEGLRSELELAPSETLIHTLLGATCAYAEPLKAPLTFLADRPRPEPTPAPRASPGVAIIGVSGRYPGAEDLESFWERLQAGTECIGARRWPASGRLPAAALLDDVAGFDSRAFGLSPAEAARVDPQERLVLRSVWECLENAGHVPDSLRRSGLRVGVFAATMWSDYEKWALPRFEAEGEASVASLHSSIANRVSWFFDFRGPSVSVNTACSSALTALGLARESLLRGECDLVIVTAVNVIAHPYHLAALASQGLLTPEAAARPFGAEAAGLVVGEGVGSVLLRRVEDAVADGDCLHGVLRAVVTGHTGRTRRLGLPSAQAQADILRACCAQAGVEPSDVTYVESAAAGTALADMSEAEALVEGLGTRGPPCLVGTVKGQLGHLEAASAMSQLTKVLLQLRAGVVAPAVRPETLSPLLPFSGTRFQVASTLQPWPRREGTPRLALVNAVGATGSVGSLLVEAPPPPSHPVEHEGVEGPTLIVLSSASQAQLSRTTRALVRALRHGLFAPTRLCDVGHTLLTGRRHLEVRVALVVSTREALVEALEDCLLGDFRRPGVWTNFGPPHAEPDPGEPLGAAARAWVEGRPLDAFQRLMAPGARRTPLPGHAFQEERLWLEVAPPASEPPRPAAVPTAPPPDVESLEALTVWLRDLYAEVSGIDPVHLGALRPLEECGLGSVLVGLLTTKLSAAVGRVPATLWYECQTLREVAAWLQAHRASALGAFSLPREHPPTVSRPEPEPEPGGGGSSLSTGELPLAIVGLAGRYPGAQDIRSFWDNLRRGVDSVQEVPAERWDWRSLLSADEREAGVDRCRWGGFIDGVDRFDPLFFRMSQAEAELTDPQERLFLQTAWEAVEDAGYNRAELKRSTEGQVGVFVGSMYDDYALLGASSTARGRPLALGSSSGSIANRVSYVFGLRGPSLALDTLCSSSLVALHLAAESLRRGECRAAIVGGVNLSLHPNKYRVQSQMNMLSSVGRCQAFGAGADGLVPAEAVGAVLMRPLADALREGDHVYGVVLATAINHGGRTNGYTVPSPSAQAELIASALKRARVEPRSVSYLEAHGTGTSLGDPIELAGLVEAFQGATEAAFCSVGSVKSNIGHAEGAAGIAALTKVLLQLEHRELVPSLHCAPLNPRLELEGSPFRIQTSLEAWAPTRPLDGVTSPIPRRAGISSFGAGGVNAHVLLQEAPRASRGEDGARDAGPQLFVFSARDEERLIESARRLHAHLARWSSVAEQVPAGPATPGHREPEGPALEALTAFLSRTLGLPVEELRADALVEELALDTAQLQEVQEWAAVRFGVVLAPSELGATVSLRSLAERLRGPAANADAVARADGATQVDAAATAAVVRERDAELAPCPRDLAYTLQLGREPLEERLAFVASTLREVVDRLAAFVEKRGAPQGRLHRGVARSTAESLEGLFDGAEGAAFVKGLAERGRLDTLATLWVRGAAVDWRLLHGASRPQRVSLPTTPFARVRCWALDAPHVEVAVVDGAIAQPPVREPTPLAPPVEEPLLTTLQALMAEVLKHPQASMPTDVSLEALGYDSVSAVKLRHALERHLKLEVPLSELEPGLSMEALARRIEAQPGFRANRAAPPPTVALPLPPDPSRTPPGLLPEPVREEPPFPFTDMQQAFIAGRELGRKTDPVGCHLYLELLFERLDVPRLEVAWTRLVRHHAMLSTRMSRRGQQRLTEVPEYRIAVRRSEAPREAPLAEHVAATREELSHKLYAPDVWPLFTVCVTRLPSGACVLHLSLDELVVDASSVELLLSQWQALYEDPSHVLPAGGTSFREHVQAARRMEAEEGFRKDLDYWMAKLTDIPPGPGFSAPPEAPAGRRQRLEVRLSPPELESLRRLARSLGSTVNTLLLTLYCDTLRGFAERGRFCVVQTFFNRLPLVGDPSLVVGPFTSSSLFLSEASASSSFESRVRAAQAQCWADLEHSRVGGVRVLRELRRAGRLPAGFSLPAVFTSTVGSVKQGGGRWYSLRVFGITQTPQVYLDHQAHEEEGALVLHWDFAAHWLPATLAQRMFDTYVRALREAASAPEGQRPLAPTEARPASMLLHRDPERSGPFGLTSLQRAYVVARKVFQGTDRSCAVYQQLDLPGLDLARIEAAWRRLVEHHEMLRTVVLGNGTQCRYDGPLDIRVGETLVASHEPRHWEAATRETAERLFGHVHALGEWPLFQLHVVTSRDRRRSVLHVAMDGMIADGPSIEMLMAQLLRLYAEPQLRLPEPALRFRDWVHSLESFAASEAGQAAREYWRERFAGLPPAPVLPRASGAHTGRVRLTARIEGWAAVRQRAGALGVDTDMVALAAYLEALATCAASPVFTVVVANWDRPSLHPDIHELVGDFCSLAWVTRGAEDLRFDERVRRYQRVLREDWSRSGVSGTEVMREFAVRRRSPGPFPVVFTRPLGQGRWRMPREVNLGEARSRTPQVLVDHLSHVGEDWLRVDWDVERSSVDEAALTAAFSTYVALLERLVRDEAAWARPLLASEPPRGAIRPTGTNRAVE
ncbi:amino acid adenylation domain-containing protein [Corallococcus sp. bb12-1]|uniref:non-ribosomal peptide synthetase n=1 Tax=Corallococcus sp. bb12-1 TaxID=2996784 RepID=UPI00226DA4A0|nr:non-ribosomal peptide synthetase [Corallococcus sp. bb12-1]MCY1042399.1 amino acid adenylation domain-containing protein [Corallococcus sp. bb12-1]